MRFTDKQFYIMRRLVNGVSKEEFWKWDQRQTRGLFFRGLFQFSAPQQEQYAIVTRKGWLALQACLKPAYRKDPTRPIFRHTARRMKTRHA